jgi:hypothetical protein
VQTKEVGPTAGVIFFASGKGIASAIPPFQGLRIFRENRRNRGRTRMIFSAEWGIFTLDANAAEGRSAVAQSGPGKQYPVSTIYAFYSGPVP